MQERPKYLDFINVAVSIACLLQAYSSKFSRKDFTQQQLMALYILKQKSKLSYDDFVDDFKTRDSAMLELGLSKVPAASTIKMFVKRMKTEIFEIMIGDCIKFTRKKKLNTAVDATGFELEDGSYHYLKQAGKISKTRKSLKLSGCADTDKHLFLSTKIRKSKAHDNKDFIPLVKRAAKIRPCRIVVADKGYDAEKNHVFVKSVIKAESIIPVRDYGNKTKHHKFSHRNKIIKYGYNKKKYRRRSIIENMFFCVKRLCGKVIYAKKWLMQKKEMLARILCYNINRIV